MAQSAKEIKEIAAAQKTANDAMEKGNSIAKDLGDLLKFSLDKTGKMNTALKDRVKILNQMKAREEGTNKSSKKLQDIVKSILDQ